MAFSNVFVALVSLPFVVCYNFDLDHSLVYVDPFNYSSLASINNGSSYFGYSVVLFPGNSKMRRPWIQISAPQGNSPSVHAKNPGLVFRCAIFGPCNFMEVDIGPSGDRIGWKKDHEWIGNVMDIDLDHDRNVICGHRLLSVQRRRNIYYYLPGTCYWSHSTGGYDQLFPLDLTNKIKTRLSNGVEGFDHAYGQAGFSAHLTRSKNESELLLGAPGVYNWHGTVLIYRDGSAVGPQASRIVSPGRLLKRDINQGEFQFLNVAEASTTDHTKAFSLTGYSTTSGYFFDKNELLYVVGAPRELYQGKVLIFKFHKQVYKSLNVLTSIQGKQIGEYFGGSLAAGDVNGDGYDDLIIGAPYRSKEHYNEGRVYVYLGSSKRSLELPSIGHYLEGKSAGGQFGLAVMYLGDLDLNGYAEIAVGAPYENDGKGAVYIFRGTQNGIDPDPSQRILAETIHNQLRGFGISISKPADVDGNHFNDLAVGAFKSNHAVLLRSRPTVILEHSLQLILQKLLNINDKNVTLTYCLWYSGSYLPPSIQIKRKLIVDEMLQRAALETEATEKFITLRQGQHFCKNFSIVLKKNLENFYDPIKVELMQELVEKLRPRSIIEVTDRTNQQKDTFCRTCPIYNKYESYKHVVLDIPFALGCGEDNLCKTHLETSNNFSKLTTDLSYIIGSQKYIVFNTTIKNLGEKAYLTRLSVVLPRGINFRSIPTACVETNSSNAVICKVENPLYENTEKTISLDLDMKDVNSGKVMWDVIYFNVTVLTTSINNQTSSKLVPLRLKSEADISISGDSAKQSYFVNITKGAANFSQIYQVQKFGASPLDEVVLTLRIPTRIRDYSFLEVYAPSGDLSGQAITCTSDLDYKQDKIDFETGVFVYDAISNVTFSESDKVPNRKRRSVKLETNASSERMTEIDKKSYPANRTFFLNCSGSDVSCSSITCNTGPYREHQNVANLILRMVFNTSSISRLLGNKDIIIIATEGEVVIKNPFNFTQTGNRPDRISVQSVFLAEVPKKTVALWIIILSIIAGLLILLLLVVGLVKAGFFRRSRKEELEALKKAEADQDGLVNEGTGEEKSYDVQEEEKENTSTLVDKTDE